MVPWPVINQDNNHDAKNWLAFLRDRFANSASASPCLTRFERNLRKVLCYRITRIIVPRLIFQDNDSIKNENKGGPSERIIDKEEPKSGNGKTRPSHAVAAPSGDGQK